MRLNGLTIELGDEAIDAIASRVVEILEDTEARAESYIGVAEAAEYLACPRSRIYALVSARRIPFHKDGSRLLFRRSELEEWVESGGGSRP
jgi:excisionase family DNA binding protein